LADLIAATVNDSKGEENESIHENDAEWQNKNSSSGRAQVRHDKNTCAYQKVRDPSHEAQNLAQLAYRGKPLF
jgi:exopolysaccharide biosynthesis protein